MRTDSLEDTITYIYTHVAIMSLGYIAFPLAPRTTPAVIAHLLSSTGAKHVIASEDASVQVLLRDACDILKDKGLQVTSSPIVRPDEYSRATSKKTDHKVVDIADNDVTLILHSSGTFHSLFRALHQCSSIMIDVQEQLHSRSQFESRDADS